MDHQPGQSGARAVDDCRGKNRTVTDLPDEKDIEGKNIKAQNDKISSRIVDAKCAEISGKILDTKDPEISDALENMLRVAVRHSFKIGKVWDLAYDQFVTGKSSTCTSIADVFPEGGSPPGENELADIILFCFNIIDVRAKVLERECEDRHQRWMVCCRLLGSFMARQNVETLFKEGVPEGKEDDWEDNLGRLRVWFHAQGEAF